jgi:glycosyltransferase involved in cell wall biosynthesis
MRYNPKLPRILPLPFRRGEGRGEGLFLGSGSQCMRKIETSLAMKDSGRGALPNHVIHISRVWSSCHGGSQYSRALVEELLNDGWDLTLLAEVFVQTQPSATQVRLAAFFRRDLFAWPRRVREIVLVWRLALSAPGAVVLIVQGDFPRLTYLLLQRLVPLIFIRQDAILTCPGNNRFLSRSRSVCRRPMGLSCLATHRAENCMPGLYCRKRVGRLALRLRDRLFLRGLRNFVTNSRYIARVHGRPARVLYPPLLTTTHEKPAPKRVLTRLIFCGRLEPVKGPADALHILSLLPKPYSLEILGDGPLREHLARLVEQLGLQARVNFCGWVDASTRDRLISSAGVLLLPSLWDEAFGMAGVEAMSLGTPVVAYDVGGVSEWGQRKGAVLVRCGEVPGAAAAVLDLTQDATRWGEHSQAARQAAAEFSRERFGREVREMVREVTRGEGGGARQGLKIEN